MSDHTAQQVLIERVEYLESKLAFQDDTIEQLNQSIIELNDQLNAVKNDLVILAEKLNDANQTNADPNQVEIPPHY